VIEHDHVCGEQSFARLLVKTAQILSASFLGADVRFAANLRPNFRIGLDRQIAQRTVARFARPVRDPLELVRFRAGE
jgi:hypothetical protein